MVGHCEALGDIVTVTFNILKLVLAYIPDWYHFHMIGGVVACMGDVAWRVNFGLLRKQDPELRCTWVLSWNRWAFVYFQRAQSITDYQFSQIRGWLAASRSSRRALTKPPGYDSYDDVGGRLRESELNWRESHVFASYKEGIDFHQTLQQVWSIWCGT